MELTTINVTSLVTSYGHDNLIGDPQQQLDAPARCHYNFTTQEFANWYHNALEPLGTPLPPQPSFHDINLALTQHPTCKQVCSNTNLDNSWCWRLPF